MFRLILFESLLSALTAHTPVPLDTTRAVENNVWRFDLLRDDTIAASLRVDCPSVEGFRPKGPADDPDYAIYGSRSVTIPLLQNDLTLYNYLEAEIYPAHPNTGVVNMNLRFDTTVPQTVGSHLWNLRPNRWNRVVCQLTDYDLHNVRSITLYTDLKGSSLALHDGMTYYIRNVRLQRRSKEIKTIGWEPEDDKIIYAHPGYLPSMRKRAIVSSRYVGQTFRVLDANGQEAYTGVVRQATTSIGHFGLCDFSSLSAPNHYTLSVGNLHTPLFMIGQMAYHRLTGLLLNGFFCQRCGCEVAGIHSACHADLFADHLGRSISYNGGWHDAGDLSQQTLQTADVAYALLESYIKWKNTDSLLAARLLEEARWGLKFMMKTRFGDGYRASSMGLLHWTDGIVGTQDDIHTVRKQNNAFDNFLYAAYAAYAAMVLPNEEEAKALRQAAIEDYDIAWSKYLKDGVDHFPFMMEHTYNVSYSLFMAGASWSSSMMYRLTGNTAYAARARLLMRNMLKCQEKGNSHTIGGYFYRDTTHRSIVDRKSVV